MKATNNIAEDTEDKELRALALFASLEHVEKPHLIFAADSKAGRWCILHAKDAEGRDHYLLQHPVEQGGKHAAIDADKASGLIAATSMPDCLKEHFAGVLLRGLGRKSLRDKN